MVWRIREAKAMKAFFHRVILPMNGEETHLSAGGDRSRQKLESF